MPTMVGQGLKLIRVVSAGDALEYIAANTYIVDPGSLTKGELLVVDNAGTAWEQLVPGTSGDVLTSAGVGATPTWETPVASFFDLSNTPTDFSGAGDKLVAVNTGATAFEFIDAPSGGGGGKEYTLAEYDTGDTYGGVPIYAVIVDFGAGPNATTKSVASGLAVNDIYQLVDMSVVGNTPTEGWVGQEDDAATATAKASFTYNKLDYKVYCTSDTDLSGVTYEVLLKYIKEPRVMAGADPHMIATVSGGGWAGLDDGVHLLTASGHTFTSDGSYSAPSNLAFSWNWGTTTTGNSYQYGIQIQIGYTSSSRSTSVYFTYQTSATSTQQYSWQTSSTATVVSPYTKGVAAGDRVFKAYTVDGKTITIGRASDFPLTPAKTA